MERCVGMLAMFNDLQNTQQKKAKLSTYTCRIDFRLLPPSPRQMGQLCVNLSLTESGDWFVNGKSKQAIIGVSPDGNLVCLFIES